MLSRVASNLYWAMRYLERAENTARLVNVHSHLLLDLPRENRSLGWEPLLAISAAGDEFSERHRSASETNVVNFMVADPKNPSSILSSLKMARENLRSTRDIIPREAWEEVNDLYLALGQKIADGIKRRTRYDLLKSVIRHNQQITGVFHGTMSHDIAYHFMRIGCYLERADMTSRIVDVRSANLLSDAAEVDLTPLENIQWMSILKSLTGYQMYRQHVRLQVRGPDVLKFLLHNGEFPRSVLYCLERTGVCLKGLPHSQGLQRRLGRLRRQLCDADVKMLAQQSESLHRFIDALQQAFGNFHGAIDTAYFSPPAARMAAA